MNKKESVIREFDLFVANWLTNDDIICFLCKHVMLCFVITSRSKTDMDFRGQV